MALGFFTQDGEIAVQAGPTEILKKPLQRVYTG
jgi:hypothetical protein